MKRKILSGKDLIRMGYPEGKSVGLAINTVLKHFRRSEKEDIDRMLGAVLADPQIISRILSGEKLLWLLLLQRKNQEFTNC